MNEREIFDAAVVIDSPSDRRSYLEQACSGDARLMDQIEELVVARQKLGSFLDSVPNKFGNAPQGLDVPPQRIDETMPPRRVGERVGRRWTSSTRAPKLRNSG